MRLKQRETNLSGGLQSSGHDGLGRDSLIQRGRGDGVQFSLVHHAGIRHIFGASAVYTDAPSVSAIAAALRSLPGCIDCTGLNVKVVRQSVFTTDPTTMSLIERDPNPAKGYRPVTELIRQKPADGSVFSMEIWGVAADRETPIVERSGANLVTIRQQGMTTVHIAQRVDEIPGCGVYPQAMAGFAALGKALAEQGIGFERVVRTWLHLGDITGADGASQRYKELNRGRSDFFAVGSLSRNRSLVANTEFAYPASTGIGAEGRDLTLGCLALVPDRENIQAIPLENPRQVSAHDYGRVYSPQSPKFSRAMVVEVGTDMMILISGTASITRSETRHLGDAAAQTLETLANIEALISQDNLTRHGLPGFGCTLANLAVARVYLKRQADYAAVRAICESRLGAVPVTYTLADVCRPQLLVEIEGIAFSQWGLALSCDAR